MSTYYLGEIRLIMSPIIPQDWMACDGSILPIAQYAPLFALVGNAYGGDGVTDFALPDLRGRVPIHRGQGAVPGSRNKLTERTVGQSGGSAMVALQVPEMPAHTHAVHALGATATTGSPVETLPAGVINQGQPIVDATFYAEYESQSFNPATFNPASITSAGESAPHENRMPTTAAQYIIAVTGGLYPQPS